MSLKLNFFNAPIYSCKDISSQIQTTGNNSKGILVICQNFNNSEISDFLKKILAAVNTDIDVDCALLDIKYDTEITWSELMRSKKQEKVLLFGIEPAQLGLNLKLVKYQLLNWNGMKILYSDSLEHVLADKNKKGFLWRELQLMFGKA